jgi:hypothetical protein
MNFKRVDVKHLISRLPAPCSLHRLEKGMFAFTATKPQRDDKPRKDLSVSKIVVAYSHVNELTNYAVHMALEIAKKIVDLF